MRTRIGEAGEKKTAAERGAESLPKNALDFADRNEAGNIADNEVLLASNGEHQMSTVILLDTKA
jgi:hypothetical protein